MHQVHIDVRHCSGLWGFSGQQAVPFGHWSGVEMTDEIVSSTRTVILLTLLSVESLTASAGCSLSVNLGKKPRGNEYAFGYE